jgi:carbonic anhydrase
MSESGFPHDAFADVLSGNLVYQQEFADEHLTGFAKEHLALITCMDSRIPPLTAIGMKPGDVKILRNAGARVTDDVLRTLVLATYLLGVERVLVMPHTDCRMASASEPEIHAAILEQSGVDTRSVEFRTVADTLAALNTDVIRIRTHPLLSGRLEVGGAIYDVHTGSIKPIEI